MDGRSLRVRFGSKSKIFTVLTVAGKAHEVSQINVKERGPMTDKDSDSSTAKETGLDCYHCINVKDTCKILSCRNKANIFPYHLIGL